MIGPNRRRDFLRLGSQWLAVWSTHAWLSGTPVPPSAGAGHRLLQLRLRSAAPLNTMRAFYGDVLGLPVSAPDSERLTVRAGATELIFTPDRSGGPRPFYHFAFNIPENKINAAHAWQTARTPLLPIPPALRDPALPPEVVSYRHWNAHSIFFFDPAGSVVEYIARHGLRNPAAGAFGPNDILYASEIAFVVDDVQAATAVLAGAARVSPYGTPSDVFAALGDESGLLLVMKRGRVISFDHADRKAVSVFPTSATVKGAGARRVLETYPYEISPEDGPA